jgi:hypothetical protein
MRLPHALRIASLIALLGVAFGAMSAVPAPQPSCRRPSPEPAYAMEILVGGRPLEEYAALGSTFVEALKGREYEVRLTNKTGERIAVALAVDGLNSIDARHTSAREAQKWILGPWESITLSGWQTGASTARRFVFTSESSSYGAWLGRTSDLGVISAAFFREVRRQEEPMAAPAPIERQTERSAGNQPVQGALENGARADKKAAAKDELAATGIGRELEHRVVRVEFDEQDAPDATISVRYEYHEALVRLHVLPAGDDSLARRERARGFSEPGYAPDPFRDRR